MPAAVYYWFVSLGRLLHGPTQVSLPPEAITTVRADATDRPILTSIMADESHTKSD